MVATAAGSHESYESQESWESQESVHRFASGLSQAAVISMGQLVTMEGRLAGGIASRFMWGLRRLGCKNQVNCASEPL